MYIDTIVVCCCIFNCVEMQKRVAVICVSYDFVRVQPIANIIDIKWEDTWQNPVLCGDIYLLYSSIASDSKHAHCVIGRELIRFVKEPKKRSLFVIDFKDIKIIPTHYSLKHYIIFNTGRLRNWKFEPSDDSTDGVNGQWMSMITNNNDQLLNRKVATHTWTIYSYVVDITYRGTKNNCVFWCWNEVAMEYHGPPSPKGVKEVCNLFYFIF
ncbi:hypothetical protein RFI_36398 [Reticulomyxa filosa]|uniref:Uncharacterized protein n=1 Tax=Reticulomyxa filosa TaxID=46433 RepID=X6LIR7_RETFI|nr:hypothetical protein RFI_36398 [Reticulomyxa filosa]|eukprot:ETO01042.1 hypothetical protein RFI_36398 [Reticulomyxa filosa]